MTGPKVAGSLSRHGSVWPSPQRGGNHIRSRLLRCVGGSVGTRRPACRQGAAGRAPRDRQAAQPKGDRGAKTDGQARAACGGAAKGSMGASAAHPMTVDRIPEREPRAAAPGVKGGKAAQGTPNGPAGLRSGQRQRRAGNQIFCPVDFIAFNRIPHYCFFHVYLINLSGMRSARTKRTNSRSKVFKLTEC